MIVRLVGSKIIQSLEIVLATLWFDCYFLSFHACHKRVKLKNHDLTDIYVIKMKLSMSFFDMNYLKGSNNFAAHCMLFIPNMR